VNVPPLLARALLEVLVEAGFVVREGERFVAAPGVAALAARGPMLAAQLHSSLGQMHALARSVESRQLAEGWAQDADVVRAQGVVSFGMTVGPMAQFMRHLPGVYERLSAPGARFLDVGSGAAGSCVGMCTVFPELRVVGLEPFEGPMAEGRKAVAASKFAERITLRAESLEQLDEREVYDAAYVAQMFFPERVLEDGLGRVLRSLKPGGYLFTGSVYDPGPGMAAAMGRFTSVLWGGGTRSAEDVAALLARVGFTEVSLPGREANLGLVVARKSA
jgi:hypothetical protein